VIRADKFAIVDPASTANNLTTSPSADSVPFGVTSGVVYIKSAAIEDASITSAKIGSVNADTITAGTISADRISADSLNASKLNLNGSSLSSVVVSGVPTLQIADAAITTAKIGDLAVQTLKIDDQAVTIPEHAYTAGAMLVSTTEKNLATITFTSTGAPTLIMFTCRLEAYGYNADRYCQAKLYKNNVFVGTFGKVKCKSSSNVSFMALGFVYQDTGAANASTTWQVRGITATFGAGQIIYQERSLYVLETKK
jgi:hypothetical protein